MKPHALHFNEGSSCPEFRIAPKLPRPDSMTPPTEHPDARVFLTSTAGPVAAYAALWWKDTPVAGDGPLGAIGGFAACDADAARQLLDAASAHLQAAGCRVAVGPMNGNTWRRHRFVTGSSGRGPFLLEPRNPADYPDWWRQAGFAELSRYSSSIIRLDGNPAVAPGLGARLGRAGIEVRALDPDRYDDELRTIHAISLKSFSANFLYTPLEEAAFLEAYGKVRDQVDPGLVRIAWRGEIPCGFVFAIRDWEADSRGETPALVVKTLAVDPGSRSAGLGSLLIDEVQRRGFELGYREAIHALQHESNTSLKITGRHHGRIFRQYALFSKLL